jgi:hypothetical protein
VPKPRKRVRLEDGLKLDLNKLIRDGLGKAESNVIGIRWNRTYSDEEVVGACVFFTKEGEDRACLWIMMGHLDQRIDLVAQPRHLGGHQWYFVCPVTHGKCSILWMPPGATRFASRQAWGKEVAYGSQFETAWDRALTGSEKIKARLIGDLDPRDWDLPPKPKWMRWDSYNGLEHKFHGYRRILDAGILARPWRRC